MIAKNKKIEILSSEELIINNKYKKKSILPHKTTLINYKIKKRLNYNYNYTSFSKLKNNTSSINLIKKKQ